MYYSSGYAMRSMLTTDKHLCGSLLLLLFSYFFPVLMAYLNALFSRLMFDTWIRNTSTPFIHSYNMWPLTNPQGFSLSPPGPFFLLTAETCRSRLDLNWSRPQTPFFHQGCLKPTGLKPETGNVSVCRIMSASNKTKTSHSGKNVAKQNYIVYNKNT